MNKMQVDVTALDLTEPVSAGSSLYGVSLRTLRQEAGFSQDELAEAAYVCRGTIQNLESCHVLVPRKDTHNQVKQALVAVLGDEVVAVLDDAYHAVRRQRFTWRVDRSQKWIG